MDFMHVIQESFSTFLIQLADILPRVIAAILLLFLGWLFAKLFRRVCVKALNLVRFDVAAEKAGIEDFLLQGGVRYTAVTIVANLFYWLILLGLIFAALRTLGIQAGEDLLNRIVLYIPNVVVAILVLLLGSLLGRTVRTISFAYLNNVGVAGAGVISAVAQWAILIFVFSLALEQLAIGGQVLVSAFQIVFGAFCLALALAFGLGGREWAAHILEKNWKNGGSPKP
jgi:hypothetical protein